MFQKPADDQDPIDSLSGDFDNCPSSTETAENTGKVLYFVILTFFECVSTHIILDYKVY